MPTLPNGFVILRIGIDARLFGLFIRVAVQGALERKFWAMT